MTRVYATPLRDAIVERLIIYGPQTSAELAEVLAKRPSEVANAITLGRDQFRIASWQRSLGTCGRLKPVYDLRTSKHTGDVPPPRPLTRNQINARWRERNAEKLRAKYRGPAGPWDALMPRGVRRA